MDARFTEKGLGDIAWSDYPYTFRNDNGTAYTGRGKTLKGGAVLIERPGRITYGLQKGSGDRVGWECVEITPDMVDQTFARFLSIELKTLNDSLSEDQRRWNRNVRASGGHAMVLRETQDGVEYIEGDEIE